ncbi:MAG: TIGR00296 family protein [Thermoplasmata archaeon]|nr:TIGR00296 family protein [Thermoplasmata archaeon]MCI4359676.1 TIGR00296 family protein [Thermoplasmata archaeon]
MAALPDGPRAVRLAREAVEYGLASPGPVRDIAAHFRTVELPEWFEEARGVFVTLTGPRPGTLRGCVGFPLPHFPLRSAIPRAAWAAASDDPRFPRVSAEELPRLLIELSILSLPERLPGGRDRADRISIGRDGLIVEADGASGLLLPQVAVEWGWGAERFLAETCRKAGLPPSAWHSEGTTVRRFQAELFRERTPSGPVEPHEL